MFLIEELEKKEKKQAIKQTPSTSVDTPSPVPPALTYTCGPSLALRTCLMAACAVIDS